MQEIWLKINGFKYYEVSNKGRVRSLDRSYYLKKFTPSKNPRYKGEIRRGRILKKYVNKYGYERVTLCEDNTERYKLVHRLVAEAFIEPIKGFNFVNHKDGNKLNNNIDNLEWATPLTNSQHASKNNLLSVGIDRKNSKLNNEKVLFILNNCDSISPAQMARIIGVSRMTVVNVIQRKTWRHVLVKKYVDKFGV